MSTFKLTSKNILETLDNGAKIRYPINNLNNNRVIRGFLSTANTKNILRFANVVPNIDAETIFSFVPKTGVTGKNIIFDTITDNIITKTQAKNFYGTNLNINSDRKIKADRIRNLRNNRTSIIINNLIADKIKNLIDNDDHTETFDLTKMNLFDIANEVALQNTTLNKFISASYDGKSFFTFSNRTINVINTFNNGSNTLSIASQSSDAEAYFRSFTYNSITLYSPEKKRSRRSGAFFPYLNMTKLDLTRYAIYNKFDSKNYNDNCLYTALTNSGLPDIKKSQLKTLIREMHIPLIRLREIADGLNICICLYKYDDDKIRNTFYGDVNNDIYKICLYQNHYFTYDENIEITSFAIKNYKLVSEHDKWFNIIGFNSKQYPKRNFKKTMSSIMIIKTMFDNKINSDLLEPITDINELMKTRFYNNINNIDDMSLEYDIETNTKITKVGNVDNSEYLKVWFDFETFTDNKIHNPYLVCWSTENDKSDIKNVHSARGSDCAKAFINRLPSANKIMLIAHSLGYDYRFLFEHVYNLQPITRGTSVLCASGIIYVRGKKVEVIMHDSYSLITCPLRDFGSMFNLDQGKEVMPYDAYNKMTTYGCQRVTIDEFKSKLNKLNKTDVQIKKDEDLLEKNLKEWGCLKKDGSVNLMKYSEIYCKIDVNVLRNGYMKFREWMLNLTKIDIDNKVTIASLAHEYLVSKDCYEDVLSLSGMPQTFIQKCIVGGRTMTANNEMWHVKQTKNNNKHIKNGIKNNVEINDTLSDFDAVSLYPSAMVAMPGFLKGSPVVIDINNYDLNKYDGYFIQILITRVGKTSTFPLLSYIDKSTGVRNFTNDMVGKTIYIDKFALDDAIKFHDIDYKIIRGYYFNSGRNTKIRDVMQYLFNARLEKKKEGNPSQIIYKLIMNAIYGKSILKPINTKTIVVSKKNIDKYCQYNYQNIKTWVEVGNKYIVKLFKPINKHFNCAQVGTEILSYSKRLMNNVMTLAEDNDINIYYQDTDSMHIETSKINILAQKFKTIYGNDLIGKQMGQFHTDFKLGECKDIVAVESIFLGKKCYIDSLIGDNTEIGYHVRLKGISNRSLLWTADQKFNGSVLELYKNLYNGHTVNFDMTCGGLAANFEFTNDMKIVTRSQFNRNINFSRGYDIPETE